MVVACGSEAGRRAPGPDGAVCADDGVLAIVQEGAGVAADDIEVSAGNDRGVVGACCGETRGGGPGANGTVRADWCVKSVAEVATRGGVAAGDVEVAAGGD